MKPARIAIFASGSGSNAQKIVEYLSTVQEVFTPLLITDNKNAKVLDRMKKYDLKSYYIPLSKINSPEYILPLLQEQFRTTHIALAGYLKLIPAFLIHAYPNKIINIHPALLPQYGGKGMYGKHVHTAVKKNMEKQSGISIHYVNENFDEGAIIYQKTTPLLPTDSVDDIEQKVQELEHKYYPSTLHEVVMR